ncbi:MAG: DUF5815 family protein [Haloarculaceae archaeon]
MVDPGVPGGRGATLDLYCGATVATSDLDLGLREFECACGESHAVVTDAHPLGRFLPESIVAVLRETVDTADEYDELKTPHVMGMVLEEFPERVASADVSDDGNVGYALVWVADFDARRLHEVVVELIVELMNHAIGHTEDETAVGEFEEAIQDFDVATFVDEYRERRDFETEHDSAV